MNANAPAVQSAIAYVEPGSFVGTANYGGLEILLEKRKKKRSAGPTRSAFDNTIRLRASSGALGFSSVTGASVFEQCVGGATCTANPFPVECDDEALCTVAAECVAASELCNDCILYVSATLGSAANSGAADSPLDSISLALSRSSASKSIIIVEEGTYNEKIALTSDVGKLFYNV